MSESQGKKKQVKIIYNKNVILILIQKVLRGKKKNPKITTPELVAVIHQPSCDATSHVAADKQGAVASQKY